MARANQIMERTNEIRNERTKQWNVRTPSERTNIIRNERAIKHKTYTNNGTKSWNERTNEIIGIQKKTAKICCIRTKNTPPCCRGQPRYPGWLAPALSGSEGEGRSATPENSMRRCVTVKNINAKAATGRVERQGRAKKNKTKKSCPHVGWSVCRSVDGWFYQ